MFSFHLIIVYFHPSGFKLENQVCKECKTFAQSVKTHWGGKCTRALLFNSWNRRVHTKTSVFLVQLIRFHNPCFFLWCAILSSFFCQYHEHCLCTHEHISLSVWHHKSVLIQAVAKYIQFHTHLYHAVGFLLLFFLRHETCKLVEM